MTQAELDKILSLHEKWLNGEKEGVRASLSGADLRNADLSNADIRNSNMHNANLKDSIFTGTKL